ncbi:MAG TPA: TonB family protein [bacterium]|nr:TonB family protein [bacterium]
MKQDQRLLKLFLLSLLLHLGIMPLFSLTLPPVRKKPLLVEVTLRQWPVSKKKEVQLARMEVPAELPRFQADARVFLKTEQAITRRMMKESLGSQPRAFLTAVQPVPVPEFRVQFPRFTAAAPETETPPAVTVAEEITGPGGQRKVIYRHQFTYPEWAQKRGLEGNIRLKFWLLPGGQVRHTELLVFSGWPELDILVEDAFRQWVFEPVREEKVLWGEIVFRLRLR